MGLRYVGRDGEFKCHSQQSWQYPQVFQRRNENEQPAAKRIIGFISTMASPTAAGGSVYQLRRRRSRRRDADIAIWLLQT